MKDILFYGTFLFTFTMLIVFFFLYRDLNLQSKCFQAHGEIVDSVCIDRYNEVIEL